MCGELPENRMFANIKFNEKKMLHSKTKNSLLDAGLYGQLLITNNILVNIELQKTENAKIKQQSCFK